MFTKNCLKKVFVLSGFCFNRLIHKFGKTTRVYQNTEKQEAPEHREYCCTDIRVEADLLM
jgi:hypothetical protein